ncbi:putative ABC transporter permease [Janthinobacterium sp. HH01]|uniref:ABC transporter permease n=1 Tax=Janthinobacterium sp. HH01 TaxID=1198452 RepID=UPI0002AEBD42|nr:ABC transporter permease [Janthinobacterium sp. HH01]ELX13433.1 putative ABC transporter permease [Janthinobacterium sp. HH01]
MFRNYLLTAWKVFMRRKLFTAINLLCIVLTLVVLLVVTALLQNAFYPSGVEGKSERFVQAVMIEARHSENKSIRRSPLGFKLIDKYIKPLKGVEAVSAVTMPETVSVYQEGRVSELLMRRTDAEYWKILDFKVLQGRVPDQADVDQGRFVAVVNASTARKLFPGQQALGQKISIGGQYFSVIGVVEDAMHLNALSDIWAPITTFPSTDYRGQMFGNFSMLVLAHTAADLPRIQRDIEAAAKTVVFDDPNQFNIARVWGDSKLDLFARMLTQPDGADSGATKLLAVIGVLMLLFMMLPALNLINLNTGRILERSSEIGVRKAFGATSAHLVRQLVLENVLLCLVGGLIGLACARVVLWWLEGSGLIPYLQVELNLAVFGMGLLLATIFGLLSGVLPAWKMSRLDPVHALKGAA